MATAPTGGPCRMISCDHPTTTTTSPGDDLFKPAYDGPPNVELFGAAVVPARRALTWVGLFSPLPGSPSGASACGWSVATRTAASPPISNRLVAFDFSQLNVTGLTAADLGTELEQDDG